MYNVSQADPEVMPAFLCWEKQCALGLLNISAAFEELWRCQFQLCGDVCGWPRCRYKATEQALMMAAACPRSGPPITAALNCTFGLLWCSLTAVQKWILRAKVLHCLSILRSGTLNIILLFYSKQGMACYIYIFCSYEMSVEAFCNSLFYSTLFLL